MFIDNMEELKEWLTKSLSPICDADPAALAKYVVALVKKDKSESELKDICNDQLDVFLQEKTKDFVEKLFQALNTKSYLNSLSSNAASTLTDVPVIATPAQQSGPPAPVVEAPEQTLANRKLSASIKKTDDTDSKERKDRSRRMSHSRSRSKSPYRRRRYDDRRKDNFRRRYNRHEDSDYRRGRRSPYRSRSRSRSRSFSRSHSRSRSRSRSPNRGPMKSNIDSQCSTPVQDHGDKDYRHLTSSEKPSVVPTVSSAISVVSHNPDTHNHWKRERDFRDNNSGREKMRCRDYDEKGFCMRGDMCLYDHGTDPVVVEDVNLPVIAYGPTVIPPPGGPSILPPSHPVPPPPAPQVSVPARPPPQMSIPPPPARGHMPPVGAHNVMSNNALQPPLMSSRISSTPPPPGTQPVSQSVHQNVRPHQPGYQQEGYNPEAPSIHAPRPQHWKEYGDHRPSHGRVGAMGPRLPHPYQPQQPRRDLVSVPTIPEPARDRPVLRPSMENRNNRVVVGSKRAKEDSYQADNNVHVSSAEQSQPPPKKTFDYNRLGPKHGHAHHLNTTLEIRKIPNEMNNIAKLNEHFGKFGTITNLQVCYGGDPEGALVTYSTKAEANKCYHSSEPVFNNRFIKVFWHNKDAQKDSHGPLTRNSTPLSSQIEIRKETERIIPPMHKLHLNNTVKSPPETEEKAIVVSPTGALTKTVFNPSALKSKQNEASQNAQKEAAARRNSLAEAAKRLEQKKKEAMKKNIEIQKQKQQLLQKQLVQQKMLIEKIEKSKNMSAEDKAALMMAIKTLAKSIEKIKKELPSSKKNATPEAVIVSPKSKTEAQKEILDIELELMTKQHEGSDTSALRQKVAALKREALSLGLLESQRGRGRGMGRKAFSRGRGRAAAHRVSMRVVDHRPKLVAVKGFDFEDKAEVCSHLQQFGELELKEESATHGIVVEFKSRMDAEKAIKLGAQFKDVVLDMCWHNPSAALSEQTEQLLHEPEAADNDNSTEDLSFTMQPDDDALEEEVDEDLLLGGDDDDEEDEEDRSWRR